MGLLKTLDYKKIINSRKARLKILKLFNWIPDKQMLQLQYKIKTGRKLNLKNPKRFTEKIQWYKLYYRDPVMAKCADKYLVREYVKSKGLGHILNKIYGVYNHVNEIDFDKLPNKFVAKKTNGGGGNDIIICKNKSNFDVETAKKIMKEWTKKDANGGGREWVYYKEKPRIIIEKYIKTNNEDLVDYKFFCFGGKAYYLYVINGRRLGDKANIGIFDINYNFLPYFRVDENKMNYAPPKPRNFDDMIRIAEVLSADFPHVRVDLYNVQGKIIFGELTFFDGSGYQMFEPDEFDYILGEQFKLPQKRFNED